MNFQEKFKNLINQSKKTTLSKDEKEAVRFSLIKFIKDNPVGQAIPARHKVLFISSIFSRSTLRYATMSLFIFLVVCFVGVGVSSAAESSLPGDLLYPVKTQVNEKVLGWLANSDEAKAKLYINLANKRLHEIEKVASEGRLNDKLQNDVEVLLDENFQNAQVHIKNTQNLNGTSADLNSTLEGSLQAHLRVISQLNEKNSEGKLTRFNEKVTKQLEIIKGQREASEDRALKNSEKIKEDSEKRVNNVKNRVKEVKETIQKRKDDISKNNYDSASKNIDALNKIISNSEEKISREDYQNAFRELQGAIRSAEELKTGISASVNLKDILEINDMEVEDDDEIDDNELEVELEDEVKIKIGQ